MNGAGFDWLNTAALKSDSDLPPPPVSFGVTPTSSTSSLNALKDASTNASANGSKQDLSKVPHPELQETEEDLVVPLSLSGDQLTRDEAKTYLRWYNDIVVRRGTSLIRLHDVFNFLSNFNLSSHIRNLLEKIFRDCVSLNVGEFFAVLRVISHTLLGETPRRRLIKVPAPILKPRSILSAKRQNEEDEEDNDDNENAQNSINNNSDVAQKNEPNKFDLDSFTQFILTGSRPSDKPRRKKKHSKRVKFSDEISVEPTHPKEVEPVKIDLSLPMDQLMVNMPSTTLHNHHQEHQQPQQQVNEDEELKEIQDQVSHFQHVKNVDSALIHGVPANIPSVFFDEVPNNETDPSLAKADLLANDNIGPVRLLSPNHTGPAPLHYNSLTPSLTGGGLQPPQPSNGFLSPNRTGPSPTPQTTNGFLSPNITGSFENVTPLAPTMTGSLSNTMRQTLAVPPVSYPNNVTQNTNLTSASPSRNFTPPAPPHPRSRSASSPIPFDQSTHAEPQYNIDTSQLLQNYSNNQSSSRVSSPLPPPPPPPSRRNRGQSLPPPPPPPSRRTPVPPLPPKLPMENQQQQNYSVYDRVLQDFSVNGTPVYPGGHSDNSNSSSTADILGDLKALQSEVDRLQTYRN